jgi:hypothetical protein
LLVAGQAQAVSSIALIWGGESSSTVTVSSVTDTTITGNVVLTADSAGIKGLSLSFLFDADLRNELDWVGGLPAGGKEFAAVKCGTGCSFSPVLPGYTVDTIESTNSNAGLLGNFDQVTTGGSLVGKTRTLGTVVFTTNALNVVDDGIDVEIVFLNNGIDGAVDTNGTVVAVSLGGGTVNSGVVPEPTTALLMVAGVLGLGLAGRRVARK